MPAIQAFRCPGFFQVGTGGFHLGVTLLFDPLFGQFEMKVTEHGFPPKQRQPGALRRP